VAAEVAEDHVPVLVPVQDVPAPVRVVVDNELIIFPDAFFNRFDQ
jgi:hypothetical protein